MLKFALAGNPNCGKTTLFNALTGSTAHVGNWPGVTVDKREGVYKKLPEPVAVVDLPGIYSLSPYTPEEVISRNFILDEKPDCVINIVDATNLERNLYLTTQIMEIDVPVVLALNMIDVVKKSGDKIDAATLEKKIGLPVVQISALKDEGIDELMQRAYEAAQEKRSGSTVLESSPLAHVIDDVKIALRCKGVDNPLFHAVKLAEGDEIEVAAHPDTVGMVDEFKKQFKDSVFEGDFEALVADARYKYIYANFSAAFVRAPRKEGLTKSDKADRVLTHRIFAFPIFFAVLALMFALTFGWPGTALSDLVEQGVGLLSEGVSAALSSAPAWIRALLVDGVLAGVGGVLVFLPQILIIFLFMSIMEDSGYMSRAAFITDRLLRRFGLSGRSFIPMLMGFGCTTTAVIAARGVENERDRRMTILLTPFMSCGAKLPVYGLITAAIFPGNSALVVLSLYLLGILLMVVAGLVLRKTTFREGETPFVMELPAYRVPSVKNVARRLWDRAKDFIVRAGTIIFAMSVVVWFLQSFSPSLQMVADPAQSMFGRLGAFIAPIFAPLGFGEWQKSVSLLSGLVAKEAVVSTMQVLYAAGSTAQLGTLLVTKFTPLSAYAYLVFILLYTPCVSAVAAIRRETGSWKYTLLSVLMQLGVAYVMALLVFQLGSLLGA